MRRLILFSIFVTLARSQDDNSALVAEIFGNKTQNNISNSDQGANDGNGNESCTTATGETGRCVEYRLCSRDDGIGAIDLHVEPCEQLTQKCCSLPSINVAADDVQQPERPGCGWRNPNGVGARLEGLTDSDARFAEFPWIVAILKTETGSNEPRETYLGAGSLIHPSTVLTTAHNVADVKGLRVRAGEWDTRTNSEPHPSQDRDVVDVKVHEDYISGTLFYDVAILFLSTPMNLAPNVGVVCLPPPNDRPRPGTRCIASGWGKDQFGKQDKSSVILRKTDLPVVDRNTCLRKLRSTRLGNLFELHTSFMCAGGEPKNDICRGDSGAPLVCPIEVSSPFFNVNARDERARGPPEVMFTAAYGHPQSHRRHECVVLQQLVGGVGYRNSHSLNETQQQKLLLYGIIL